jgi:hypothetical protein
MKYLSFPSRIVTGTAVFFVCLSCCLLVTAAAGADVDIEGYLGQTFTLHGASYVGNAVYLFMTGPGLPANGVTLTDTSLRADQGHFTVVGLDNNQEWTFIWKTSRIESQIDPGTYTVYVTNEPADLSHLGGSSSYKTYSFFLKDSGDSKVSVDTGNSYTINPEEHVSTPNPVPPVNLTSVAPMVTSAPPYETVPVLPVQTLVPLTTRAGTGPWAAVIALVCSGCFASFLKARP